LGIKLAICPVIRAQHEHSIGSAVCVVGGGLKEELRRLMKGPQHSLLLCLGTVWKNQKENAMKEAENGVSSPSAS